MAPMTLRSSANRLFHSVTGRALMALRLTPRSRTFPALGVVFSLVAGLGLPVARALDARQSPTPGWLFADVAHAPVTYAYVMFSSMGVITIFGFLIGRWCDRARLLSITDPLTGLFNRRHFTDRLAREVIRARRGGNPTSVLCLDLDHLKEINDHFGHQSGDEVIVAMARSISMSVRSNDVVARSGGDEFVVLLPGRAEAEARGIADRILATVAARNDELTRRFEVSIGVAELGANGGSDDLVAAADAALYRAKAAGGRQAAVSSEESARSFQRFTLTEAALQVRTRRLLISPR